MSEQNITKPEFFFEICMKGSSDIRKVLKISNEHYNFIHHRGVTRSRDYFLYSAMNEIEKAGISLHRANDFIVGDQGIDENDRLTKNILQSLQEELLLWIRKMTELLAELMLFSKINDDAYYRHFMLVKDLKSLNDTIKNTKTAYGCHIQNYQKQVDDISKEITDLEATAVDIQKCWYLANNGKKGRVSGIKGKLSTLDERINSAFEIANPNQIIALGTSFEEGYANFSTAIHFSTNAKHSNQISIKAIHTSLSGMGVLAGNIVVQSRFLLKDFRKKCYSAFLTKIFRNSVQAKIALNNRMNSSIKKGDFVNAQGELAEVVRIMRGRYGLKSFRVKFLLKEDTTIAGSGKMETVWTHQNPDFEEYPAMWVGKLYSKKNIADGIKREILKHEPNAKVETRKLTPIIRETVIHMWKNVGLKESAHGMREKALEKMKQELEKSADNITKPMPTAG